MRVLVLDEWLPSVCNSGKSIRTFELLSPLARSHSITYLVNQAGIAPPEQLSRMRDFGFEVICAPRPLVYGSLLSIFFGVIPALFDVLPISVRRHVSQDFAGAVKRLISERQFDVVHIEWSHYAFYSQFICGVPVFACTHNIEYLSWRRFFDVMRNPFKKALGFHEWQKMYLFEKRIYSKLDYISTVSSEDASILRNEFGVNDVCVIPNGVSISYYDEVANEPDLCKIIYCGSMDSHVNQDAVLYFLREIFPLALERNPLIKFEVIGRNPPDWLLRFSSSNVSFTGSVADVRKYLKSAGLAIAPIRIAGGSRLKILEAFAAGVPVLSTTIGAEGLEVEPNTNIAIANTPAEFATKIVEILTNKMLREKLIKNARRLVDEKYDWSQISPLVESAWQKTIKNYKSKNERIKIEE
ncbi:MAG: glycosyltransferase family 4 protein [Planctomycetaceae bacterium]|jgi:glycosyltransferase involved in cell wall biosynthesis|nr:glycosyltransferase family 4 protein [Planctomycetaceae bacterium]